MYNNIALHFNYKSNHIYFQKYIDYYLQFNFDLIFIHINSNLIDTSIFNILNILNILNENYNNSKVEIILVLNNNIIYNAKKLYSNPSVIANLDNIFKNIDLIFKIDSDNLLLINNKLNNLNNLNIDINDNIYLLQSIYIYNYILYDTCDIERISNYNLKLYKNNQLSISNYMLNKKLYIKNYMNIILSTINVNNFTKVYNTSLNDILLFNIEYNDIFDLFLNIFNSISNVSEKNNFLNIGKKEEGISTKIDNYILDKYKQKFISGINFVYININLLEYTHCLTSLYSFDINKEKLLYSYSNFFNIKNKNKNKEIVDTLVKNLYSYYSKNKINTELIINTNSIIKYYFKKYTNCIKIIQKQKKKKENDDTLDLYLSYKYKYNFLITNFKKNIEHLKITTNTNIIDTVFDDINFNERNRIVFNDKYLNSKQSYLDKVYSRHINHLYNHYDKYIIAYEGLLLKNQNGFITTEGICIKEEIIKYRYMNLHKNNIDIGVIKNIINIYKNKIDILINSIYYNVKNRIPPGYTNGHANIIDSDSDDYKYKIQKILYLYYKKMEDIII